MPLIMRRCGSFGCPVQGFSGGRCGSSRRHCASVKSPRPTQPIWDRISETSALCRHALASRMLAGHPQERDKRNLAMAADAAVPAVPALQKADLDAVRGFLPGKLLGRTAAL